jgi:hypothetical protein
MDNVLARRIFLVVVDCLLALALVSGIVTEAIGTPGAALDGDDAAVAASHSMPTSPAKNSSVKEGLVAADGDIASSGANVDQAAADMKEASNR